MKATQADALDTSESSRKESLHTALTLSEDSCCLICTTLFGGPAPLSHRAQPRAHVSHWLWVLAEAVPAGNRAAAVAPPVPDVKSAYIA